MILLHYDILSIRLENIANQNARKRRNKTIIALLPVFGKLKRNLEKTPTVHFVSKKQANLKVPRVYFLSCLQLDIPSHSRRFVPKNVSQLFKIVFFNRKSKSNYYSNRAF